MPDSDGDLGIGRVGVVVANDLRLRKLPSLDGEIVGYAMQRWYGWIYEGPVEDNGLTWYRVGLQPTDEAPFGCLAPPSPCNPPPTDGWLAAGPEGTGEWFEPVPCPTIPTNFEALASVHWLLTPSCFGETPISLTGRLTSECAKDQPSVDVEPAWLGGRCWRLTAGPDNAAVIWVHFREDVPATPNEGVSLVGHFDDPDSLSCVPAASDGLSPEEAVRLCRSSFVVDEWQYTE